MENPNKRQDFIVKLRELVSSEVYNIQPNFSSGFEAYSKHPAFNLNFDQCISTLQKFWDNPQIPLERLEDNKDFIRSFSSDDNSHIGE